MNIKIKKNGIALCLLFITLFSGRFSISNAEDKKSTPQKEIVLSDSTIEGNVLQPMKIPLISLEKERKERIQRQLNQKIQIKKRFNTGQSKDKTED